MPAAAAIPLAGKLLPFLVKAGSAANVPMMLRTAGTVAGAAPGLMEGNLGKAVLGGGLGAASTFGWGGLANKAQAPLAGVVRGQLGNLGVTGQNLWAGANAARAAIPIAGGLVAGSLGSGMLRGPVTGATNRALGGGSGIIGYNAVTGEPITAAGAAVPQGLGQYGGTNMYGSNPYDVLDPSGAMAANRLMSRKQAEVAADNINTIAPTQLKYFEETKRRDLERQLAAAGIRQNIATQAGMLTAAQQAGLNQASTALSQVGGAMANNYSYS
jgi:hypothetical protein